MDEQVLSVQLDPSRMEESFDPVPEVIVYCLFERLIDLERLSQRSGYERVLHD